VLSSVRQEISRYCCPGRVVSVLEGGYGKYEKVKLDPTIPDKDKPPTRLVLNVRGRAPPVLVPVRGRDVVAACACACVCA
jgi:hypothetical protein